MSTLYHVERANLFAGDHDRASSKHLAIEELKLPTLQEIYADHHAGGARAQIEIPVGMEKLEPTFKLKGFDPQLMRQFGLATRTTLLYTAYGAVTDRLTGETVELVAKMRGRLGKIEADAFQSGEASSTDYAINGLLSYEVRFDGRELVFWDFATSAWRIDGVDPDAQVNRILRIA